MKLEKLLKSPPARLLTYYFSWIILLMAMGIILYVGYLLFHPFKTMDVVEPIKIVNENKEVKVGEPIKSELEFCRYTDRIATVTTVLEGPIQITYPPKESRLDPGCRTIVGGSTSVQEYTPPGEYRLKIVAEYKMNPIRTITKVFYTEEFNVVE